MTVTQNFLGIPIDGDITRGDRRVPQRPLSELEPLIRAVLDDPTIHSFGWTQYTPYFNDGDPCVFSVNTPWYRTVEDVENSERAAARERREEGLRGLRIAVKNGAVHPDVLARAEAEAAEAAEDEYDEDYEDDYNYELSSSGDGHPTLGVRPGRYDRDQNDYVYGAYVGPDEARFDRVKELDRALQGGAFEDVLLEAFGDHARVIVRSDGITIETYDHD